MSKKMMETAPRQQSQSPYTRGFQTESPVGADTLSTDTIVPDLPPDVKALKDLIERRHIPLMDIAEVVQTIYPKCDRTLISKCAHGNVYGIQMRANALAALTSHFRETSPDAQKSLKKVGRTKPRRIYCRLAEASYLALQRLLTQSGITMQGFIENLILTELKKQEAENGKGYDD